jgi:hypothetical protein
MQLYYRPQEDDKDMRITTICVELNHLLLMVIWAAEIFLASFNRPNMFASYLYINC